MNFIYWLEGKKTYFVALAIYAYAVGGLVTGNLDVKQTMAYLLSSGGLAALRGAIAKIEEYLPMLYEVWQHIKAQSPVTPAPLTAGELAILNDLTARNVQSTPQS